ncbi:MAG TPA: flagellar biosynthetic protein FliO [Chloroflexota bacterium]|nr:flagellar biosynthetic protein FliO [Chloroflexota bacterium]
MAKLATNRLLWAVLGVVFIAMLGMSAVSSQMSSPKAASSASPAASASAPASAAASGDVSAAAAAQASTPAKPFLADYQDPQPQAQPTTIWTIVGLIVKLGIVIGLIYLCIVGLRFFGNRGRKVFMGDSAINVLEKTALAQNRELYLVDVANKVLLLGATSTNIAVLTEITDEQAIENLRLKQDQPVLPAAEPFLTYLKNVGEKVGSEVASVNPLRPADLLKRIEAHKERVRAHSDALGVDA